MPALFSLEEVQSRLTGDIEAARLVYAEEIMDWTDAYNETYGEGGDRRDVTEQLQKLRSIGRLWMSYAGMEQQLKQWKKVVQVFEDALVDPVGGSNLEVYLAYVTFCRGRGKMSNAQKVFVRALTQDCALHNPPFHEVRFLLPGESGQGESLSAKELLWAQFLIMMRDGGKPDLKLEQLYNTLSSQMPGGSALIKPKSFEIVEQIVDLIANEGGDAPGALFEKLVDSFVLGIDNVELSKNSDHTQHSENRMDVDAPLQEGVDIEGSPLKRSRQEASVSALDALPGSSSQQKSSGTLKGPDNLGASSRYSAANNRERTVGNEVRLKNFQDLSSLVNSGTADQGLAALLTRYRERPTLLFSAPHKEPLQSGFEGLDSTLIDDLEKYFSSSGIGHGHNSADSLALDMAAANKDPATPLAQTVLVLEALWTCQGLQESHFDKWFNTLIKTHRSEQEAMQRQHYEEESKLRASKGSSTSLTIMRAKHEHALRSLRVLASLQTDLLNANINRTLCLLRQEQEQVLRLLNFPYSTDIESEKLYNHYNDKKVKAEKENDDTVDSSIVTKFENMHKCLLKQRKLIGVLLSLCPAFSKGRETRPESTVTKPQLHRISSSFSVTGNRSDPASTPLSPHSPDSMSGTSRNDDVRNSGKKKRRRKLVDAQEQLEVLRQRSSSVSGYSNWGGNGTYDPFRVQSSNFAEKESEKLRMAALIFNQNQLRAQKQAAVTSFGPGDTIPAQDHTVNPDPHLSLPGNVGGVPSVAPAASTKSNNLAKIAALLASKKANKS